MAFFNLSRDLFENVTISLTPSVSYTSGSTEGVTGSVHLSPFRSKCIKEVRTAFMVENDPYNDRNDNFADGRLEEAELFKKEVKDGDGNFLGFNIEDGMEDVLTFVDINAQDSLKMQKKIRISRIEQPVTFASGTVIKRHIQNVLMPYYKHKYDDCGYYYENYHTLNFCTSSYYTGSNGDGVYSDHAVLIYPNKETIITNGPNFSDYTPHPDLSPEKHAFTLQFWINPRYKNGAPDKHFHAGTIYHASSSLAVSLISGSQVDQNGLVDSYKILVQARDFMSESAALPHEVKFNTEPGKTDSDAEYGITGENFWMTSSFEMSHNHWHHVTVRWGGKRVNNYTGSIIIDGNKTEFVWEKDKIFGGASGNHVPAICIGNFFQGRYSTLKSFFNSRAKYFEGVIDLTGGTYTPPASTYRFENPLNAEIHEIKFYNNYLTDSQLLLSGSGPVQDDFNTGSMFTKRLLMYIPPFYYPESHQRERLYHQTFKVTTSSHKPINELFAFSSNGKEINLENFTKELVKGLQPRLFNLTSSLNTGVSLSPTESPPGNADVNDYSFGTGSIAKRNLTILPNDNGLFKPNYYAINRLSSGSIEKHFSSGSLEKGINYHLIKIESLLDNKTETTNQNIIANSLLSEIVGQIRPQSELAINTNIQEKIQTATINDDYFPLALAEDLNDDSSNYISVFNISNLYYGNRIHPGSFEIIEPNLTGSQGSISIKLKDNERGALYRADCLTKQATWNTVGNIFYDEGLVIIKSPHLPMFGKKKFEMNFKGEQNVHSMVVNIPVGRSTLNKSNNPTFVSLPKSNNTNDENSEAIAISGVNIHDENFNIIMRAKFAQPIIKDNSDEFVVRLKMDF